MSRLPNLRRLSAAEVEAAAVRILAHPTANVQRVAMDEVYSLALELRDHVGLLNLAAQALADDADPADRAGLRTILAAHGFGPATQETAHG